MTYRVGVAVDRTAVSAAVTVAVAGQRAEVARETCGAIKGIVMPNIGSCSLLHLCKISTTNDFVPVENMSPKEDTFERCRTRTFSAGRGSTSSGIPR